MLNLPPAKSLNEQINFGMYQAQNVTVGKIYLKDPKYFHALLMESKYNEAMKYFHILNLEELYTIKPLSEIYMGTKNSISNKNIREEVFVEKEFSEWENLKFSDILFTGVKEIKGFDILESIKENNRRIEFYNKKYHTADDFEKSLILKYRYEFTNKSKEKLHFIDLLRFDELKILFDNDLSKKIKLKLDSFSQNHKVIILVYCFDNREGLFPAYPRIKNCKIAKEGNSFFRLKKLFPKRNNDEITREMNQTLEKKDSFIMLSIKNKSLNWEDC